MDAIDYLRSEIKSYFPDSRELQLSIPLPQHRRFNFYFEIKSELPYLLYLNWDGDGDRFTIKCLEFASAEILANLISLYPDKGSNTFNMGKPRVAVAFICRGENRLFVSELRGTDQWDIHRNEISAQRLLQLIDPAV